MENAAWFAGEPHVAHGGLLCGSRLHTIVSQRVIKNGGGGSPNFIFELGT